MACQASITIPSTLPFSQAMMRAKRCYLRPTTDRPNGKLSKRTHAGRTLSLRLKSPRRCLVLLRRASKQLSRHRHTGLFSTHQAKQTQALINSRQKLSKQASQKSHNLTHTSCSQSQTRSVPRPSRRHSVAVSLLAVTLLTTFIPETLFKILFKQRF